MTNLHSGEAPVIPDSSESSDDGGMDTVECEVSASINHIENLAVTVPVHQFLLIANIVLPMIGRTSPDNLRHWLNHEYQFASLLTNLFPPCSQS